MDFYFNFILTYNPCLLSKFINNNYNEIEYIFEFCYRRAMTAQTNKIANVNKITWEKRFNSLASIKECLETN